MDKRAFRYASKHKLKLAFENVKNPDLEYKDFFAKKLKMRGADNLADLSETERKEMFDEIDKLWLAKDEQNVEDHLSGGVGDDAELSSFDPEQVVKGIEVEMEHTDNRGVALEIALDHLTEDPRYYDKLELIEPNH